MGEQAWVVAVTVLVYGVSVLLPFLALTWKLYVVAQTKPEKLDVVAVIQPEFVFEVILLTKYWVVVGLPLADQEVKIAVWEVAVAEKPVG